MQMMEIAGLERGPSDAPRQLELALVSQRDDLFLSPLPREKVEVYRYMRSGIGSDAARGRIAGWIELS